MGLAAPEGSEAPSAERSAAQPQNRLLLWRLLEDWKPTQEIIKVFIGLSTSAPGIRPQGHLSVSPSVWTACYILCEAGGVEVPRGRTGSSQHSQEGGTPDGSARHLPIATTTTTTTTKSPQSCPTLFDPIDCSPPGSPVPGILQARTLEWVGISFSTCPLGSIS